jgi:chaperonin GroEL (HSP60 family)
MNRSKSERSIHERVINSNIVVAKSFVELIKSTLGPLGLHRIIVDDDNFILVTRDGRTIFDNIEVIHPVEKLLVELTRAVDSEAGDGTTSAVILAGELLSNAEKLISAGFHPSIIIEGYKKAAERATQLLNELSVEGSREMMRKAAFTALNSKTLDLHKEMFADLIIEAILLAMEDGYAHPQDVHFERVEGKSTMDTELFPGIIVESSVIVPHMPSSVENARIALLNAGIAIGDGGGWSKKKERSVELNLEEDGIEKMHRSTFNFYETIARGIVSSGANVVINQRSINNVVLEYLGKHEILAIADARKADVENVSTATGAKIVSDIDSLRLEDLGFADKVEERRIGDFKFVFINAKAATILIRGGSRQVVDETYRTFHDALHSAANALNDRILPGGGASEEYVANSLRKYAFSIETREQFAVMAFADSLEAIPRTLASNSGEDPIEAIMELRRKHADGGRFQGLNTSQPSLQIIDVLEEGIIDPLITKKQIIKCATETAQIILRADDYIPKK